MLSFDTDIAGYTWSPDGKQVAFIANEKEPAAEEAEGQGFFAGDLRGGLSAHAGVDRFAGRRERETTTAGACGAPVGHSLESGRNTPCDGYRPDATGRRLVHARKVHVFDADDGSIVSSFQNPGSSVRPHGARTGNPSR